MDEERETLGRILEEEVRPELDRRLQGDRVSAEVQSAIEEINAETAHLVHQIAEEEEAALEEISGRRIFG